MSEPAAPPPDDRARRQRSWAILLALLAFVVLIYALTLVKMG